MDPRFQQYAEALHPAYERLVAMTPVCINKLPSPVSSLPTGCIYLFSEGGRHLYVGRTRRFLRERLSEHSRASAKHNQAVFAFRLARQATGKLEATYDHDEGSRSALE